MTRIGCGAAVAVWLAMGIPAAGLAKDKPVEVQVAEQFDAAVNAARLPAAGELFADDASVKAPETAGVAGRVQIEAWLQSLATQSWHMESGNRQASEGGRVTYPTSLAYDTVRRLSVSPVDGFVEVTVLGGKIRSLVIRLSAASQLRILQAQSKANEAVARLFVDAVLAKGDLARADALLAAGFVDHDPAPGKNPDAAGFKGGVTALRASFPDLAYTIEDVIVSGERISVRGFCTGTQNGAFLGAPASGRAFRAGFVEVLRLQGDRIAERWGAKDAVKMIDQLGIVCGPAVVAPAVAPTATTTGQPAEKKKSSWF